MSSANVDSVAGAALPSDAVERNEYPNLRSTLTHGKSRKGKWSPEYYSWASMIQRCTNPRRNNWHLYGGRGISVSSEWRRFEAFYADMGTRPNGHSLGRIDPDGDYCVANCRWETAAEQARSRRNNRLTECDAVKIKESRLSSRVLASQFGVSHTMIKQIRAGLQWKA